MKNKEGKGSAMAERRTIRVTGKGRLSVAPDQTKITITLEGVRPAYAEALARCASDTERLRELFAGFDFEPGDLKTLNFNVDTEYESYEENGAYKQRLVGYRYRHLMKVEFPSDNERLGRILYALSTGTINPEFKISYTVRDPESVKNRLLGAAVEDAREKAETLAASAGVSLGRILCVNCTPGEPDMEVRPMGRMMMAKANMDTGTEAFGLSVEPDSVDLSDSVTVIWEIE